ncbi:MAG: hypothetical protein M1827_006241 [Pycnora praestabilis]|nr:MAG: hypothetical protein M1827_006241 [Pycnora praestabilis]
MVQRNGAADGIANGGGSGKPDNWIPVREEVMNEPCRKMRVVTIGAGFSGLTMANKIQNTWKLDHLIDHTIYEKNSDIGGTWFENRYPGVQCDVAAHIYTLVEIPNPDWNGVYATGPEIQQYLKKITKEHHLDRDIQLNSTLIEALWEEGSGTWKLTIKQGDSIIHDECDVFINASGVLNITGLHEYKGHLCHSADWVEGYDYNGKIIAVIGNGSSAIQILPEMQKVAKKVTNYARSPTWIFAPFAKDIKSEVEPEPDGTYSEEMKERFRNDPNALKNYRKTLINNGNHFYKNMLMNDSPTHREATNQTKATIKERLKGHEELIELLTPDFALGCRRLTPGEGYLEALVAENVEVISKSIECITASGIQTIDGLKEFDAIVCATGFDVSFRPRWLQVGRHGKILADE